MTAHAPRRMLGKSSQGQRRRFPDVTPAAGAAAARVPQTWKHRGADQVAGATTALADKAAALLALHRAPEILVLANVSDAVSAQVVASTDGARALATAGHSITSTFGHEDGENIPLELHLDRVARIVRAVDLPVTMDFEALHPKPPHTRPTPLLPFMRTALLAVCAGRLAQVAGRRPSRCARERSGLRPVPAGPSRPPPTAGLTAGGAPYARVPPHECPRMMLGRAPESHSSAAHSR